MGARHRRHVDLRAIGLGRWVLISLGAWALLTTLIQPGPRYQLLPEIVIALTLILAGAVPRARLALMRKLVAKVATGVGILAGVVASFSHIEALALLADAAVLFGLTLLFRERVKPVGGRHRAVPSTA